MQLILKTDADIGIGSNMSVLKQGSFSLKKKSANNDVTGKFKNDTPSVTEVNAITNNKENSTESDILEKDGSLVNGKVDENLIEISAHSESDQELSVKSKVISNKDEKVDEVEDSINSNHENENNTTLQDNLKTCDNLNEEHEDQSSKIIEKHDMKIKNDKEENICDEIDLDKSEIIEQGQSETRESNLLNENKSEQNMTLETASENVSCKEPDSSSNKYDSKQPEIQKTVDAETIHKSEQPTERKDEKCKSDKQDVTELEFTMRVKNVSEINDKVINEKNQGTHSESSRAESISLNKTENRTDSPVVNEAGSNNDKIFDLITETNIESKQNNDANAKNDEVIDIGDDKDDECVTVEHDKSSDVEKEAEETQKMSTSEISTSNENDEIKNDDKSTKEETRVENIDKECNKNSDISKLEQDEQKLDNEIIKDKIKETSSSTNATKEKKPLLHISKLSNTLDILSDDDEEEPVPEVVPEIKETDEKQCISIEDDDDIMLIDEESPNDDNKTCSLLPPESDMPENEETKDQTTENDNDVTMDVDKSNEELTQKSKVDDEKVKETGEESKDEQLHENIEEIKEKSSSPKPLLPVNFLKSCKKNFAEMTREELEEFCVLKIVESVVDRSNLSEMNLQLKAMSQNIDDYKKKTNTLLKQNRDLQVVLKSIQEEQKKNSGQPITPLKITRSVGMQVFMIETPMARKRTVPGNKFPTNSPNAVKQKSQSPKTPKVPNNLQIPVPRLVPANNNAVTNNKQASTPVANKVQGVPNGVKSSPPTTKPEKRSFNKMQQGNSITVDLTDDEPPSKVAPRNVAPPVRLVPQQSLLTSQRPQFLNTANIPRKVYIPISGSQNPASPGQTIMLKQVAPHVPRLRGPGAHKSSSSVRMPRVAPKHPAPLPDSMKQYQPPNWKALPPPPELKLSKVENGIVISWKIDGYQEENHEEIASYQLYAYQETSSPPSTSLWKKIGDVKALPLPMACTLTQFMAGYKYYFAVRAVDVRSRLGPFSLPGNILLLNKM